MTARDFKQWTYDAATCYFNRMQCSICSNKTACDIGDRNFKKVGEMYGLRKIKEAVLRIYANIGLKGIERFRNIYFFEYCPAEPKFDINYDSYMFIGVVKGCDEKREIQLKKLSVLEKLNKIIESDE